MLHRRLCRTWMPSSYASATRSAAMAGVFAGTRPLLQATSFGVVQNSGASPAGGDLAFAPSTPPAKEPSPAKEVTENVEAGKPNHKEAQARKSVWEFTVQDAKGRPYSMKQNHGGKVLLVVNTASRCKSTKEGYETATALRAKYKERGFDIAAFPCDQFFGGLEPTTAEEVSKWASKRYKIDFPILEKVTCNAKFNSLDDKQAKHLAAWEAFAAQKKEQRQLKEAWLEKKPSMKQEGSSQDDDDDDDDDDENSYEGYVKIKIPTLDSVRGPTWDTDVVEHPLYTYLKLKTKPAELRENEGNALRQTQADVKSNFTWFLIDRDGRPRIRFEQGTTADRMGREIDFLLDQKAGVKEENMVFNKPLIPGLKDPKEVRKQRDIRVKREPWVTSSDKPFEFSPKHTKGHEEANAVTA